MPQSTVSAWSRGRVPEMQAVLALQAELGIDPADWFRAPPARALARVEKSIAARRKAV